MPEVNATHINNLSIGSQTNKYDEFICFMFILVIFLVLQSIIFH